MGKTTASVEDNTLTNNSLASIYTKHGTHVPVAQVHGSAQYQALMRSMTTDGTSSSGTNGSFCSLLAPAFDKTPSATAYTIDICQPSDVLVLKTMLGALNATVEAYLGTIICFAALALDTIDGNLAQITQEALQALDIRQVLGTQRASGSVVRAHPLSVYNGTDLNPYTVLAIDYSSPWFKIGLFTIEETGLVDPVLGLIDGLRIGGKRQLEAFRIALNDLAENTPSHVKSPDILIMYGDDANNREILVIIASVFGSQITYNAYMSTSAHDGLDYVAKGAYEHMETIDFEMRVSASFSL